MNSANWRISILAHWRTSLSNLIQTLTTVQDWLRYAVSRFTAARLAFGHGSLNAYDEAAYLILHTLHLPIDTLEPFLPCALLPEERERLRTVIERRASERVPAAYITGEAFLHDYRFEVTPAVIVPRSFIAGMILDHFQPWHDISGVHSALDLCTGSGCLAILLAHTLPDAEIDAIDLSPAALAVAARNVEQHGVEVTLIESDLFTALGDKTYDLIVSNPPYVDAEAMAVLPDEYRHEPEMALASGEDGLDATRVILREAKRHLNPGGLLAVEIGHNRLALEATFPHLEFTWPDLPGGEDMVFLLGREQLPD